MKARTGLIAAAALLAPGAAGAEAPPPQRIFGAALKGVRGAAERGGDSARLERSRAAPPRLGFAYCQATGDEKKQYWLCGQSFAPEALSRDKLAAGIAECLPDAVRGESSLARDAVFTLPYARITISEVGGPRAHVGRFIELAVEAIPAP